MKASDSEVRRAFLGLTGGQPCMLEALCRRGSPLWVIIQHTTKKVWESRSSLKQEVVFLHQNIVKAPEPEWTDTEKITCNTRTGLSCDKKTKQRRLNGLETHLCGWNNLQNIYQRRQQLEGFYPATPQSERCGLQGGMQRVSSGSSVIRLRCSTPTFLQGDGFAGFGPEQGVSGDQLEGLGDVRGTFRIYAARTLNSNRRVQTLSLQRFKGIAKTHNLTSHFPLY